MEQTEISENQTTHNQKAHYKLLTKSLQLRPYCKSYVKQYNSWFNDDPDLLYLTGSQPLKLEEEYQNHEAWLTDPKKYTFIIFTKGDQSINLRPAMIGDINLFFSEWIQPNESEINVMIARKEYRGMGFAREAVEAVETFVRGIYDKDTVIAKIKHDNVGSKKLFQKIGYSTVNFSQHFKQYQLRKIIPFGKEQAFYRLKKAYQIEQINNIEELFQLSN